jgi:UDP-glucose 4-epimerase
MPFTEDVSDSVIGPSTSPRWAYAVSKLFDEHLAFGFQDDMGVTVTILRFFGSYGPNQHISWWGGAPPVFIDSILRSVPVPIHGDGSQRRSFTFIDDVVDAVVESLTSDHADGQIFNVGSEEEVSILELAHLIKKLSGTDGDLEVEFIDYESFTGKPYPEVMRRVPSTDKLLSKLGISCATTLEDGLERTIAWQAERTI